MTDYNKPKRKKRKSWSIDDKDPVHVKRAFKKYYWGDLMRKFIFITMIFFSGLSLWGCTYYAPPPYPPPQTITTPSREVFTITQTDMGGTDLRNHYLNVRTNQFGAGETPCVLVKGYSGETVIVELYNLDTGKLRAQNTVSAPQSQIPYLCYPRLGNGSFKADVFLHGALSGTTTFGVSR